MTVEQLEARRADLVTRLQSAKEQKRKLKAAVSQIEGAIMLTDEFLTALRGNGAADESADLRRDQD